MGPGIAGFDRIPELAAPLAREWGECVQARRTASLRMAELLVEFRRMGVLPDLSPPIVVEFGIRHGLSAAEARQFADVGLALVEIPALAEDVRRGDVSLQSAGQLGRIAKDATLFRTPPLAPPGAPPVAPEAALAEWLAAARAVPSHELKAMVDRRVEEVRTGSESVVALTIQVPDATRRDFRRAREIASRRAGGFLTEGQTLGAVVDHYLDSYDPDRVKPRKRRMPDTRGAPGRHFPAAVRREVLARTGGRCTFPACTNRTWVDLAHRIAHAAGGCREAWNAWGLCRHHHRRYDRGEFTIEGPTDAPKFYDSKGRRIWPNGRISESAADDAKERAPP